MTGERGNPSPLPLWVSLFEISKSLCTAYRVELCELFFMDVDKVLEMILNSVDAANMARDYAQYTGNTHKTPSNTAEKEVDIWDYM